MDLAVGARRTWVMMTLFTKDGAAKLVRSCSLPLTGVGCVSRVYSDLAVIDLSDADGQPLTTPRVLETTGITLAELMDRLDLDLVDATEGRTP